jgi:hypothetical protein
MTDLARSAGGGSATVAGRRLPGRELAPAGLSEAEETAVGLDLDRLGLSLLDNGDELLLDRDPS